MRPAKLSQPAMNIVVRITDLTRTIDSLSATGLCISQLSIHLRESRGSPSNGEVEGPPSCARSSAAGAHCLQRPRRGHAGRSRTPPTIVRTPMPFRKLQRSYFHGLAKRAACRDA